MSGRILTFMLSVVMLLASPMVCCCGIRSVLDHVAATSTQACAPPTETLPACPHCAAAKKTDVPQPSRQCHCKERSIEASSQIAKITIPALSVVATIVWRPSDAPLTDDARRSAIVHGRAPPWRHPPQSTLLNQRCLLLI